MGLAASGQSAEYHYLVEFTLDSTTLRWADEDLSIQESNTTGYFYAGRLPQSATIVRDLGTFMEPHETIQNFDLQVDNRDGHVQELIRDNVFANRRVRLWIGTGNRRANYSQVFIGQVAHPNGVSWDEDVASFSVIDQRIRHRRLLPRNRFLYPDTYPNVEPKGRNRPIPIVYGDWGLSAGSGNASLAIPVICTDMSTAQKRFKVSDHGLHTLARVLKNAVALNLTTQVNNICLTDGTFRIATGVAFSGTTDTISVNCKGIKTANGTMIEKPMDVLRNLQTAWLGLTATDLNVTAYQTVNISGTENEVVRRFIDEEASSEVMIAELLNESRVDMRFIGGKYSPKHRTADLASVRVDFRDFDIMLADEQTEKADFQVVRDPDRFFANKIRAQYRWDPINGLYDRSYTRQVTASVQEVSAVVERVLDFSWYYRQTDTTTRVDRELAQFTKETQNIQFSAGPRALLLNLADQIDLTYNIFAERAVQVRRIELDMGSMVSRISGFNLFMSGLGRWTSDAAPTWTASSLTERGSQGYWCDGSGFASAPNQASLNISRWY